MPNKNYLKGRRLEWQVKKDLELAGWTVIRASGSHGVSDLVAWQLVANRFYVRFIQCKVTKSEKRINTLLNDHALFLPPATQVKATDITQELIVKVEGNSKYTTYNIGGVYK